MNKIKNYFLSIIEKFKKNFKEYPFTNFVIIIATLILLFINLGHENGDFIEKLKIFSTTSAVLSFMSETFISKKWKRIVSYSIIIAVSSIFVVLQNLNNEIVSMRTELIWSGILISTFFIGIIKVINDSKLETHEYATKIFQNVFYTLITYLILNIGLFALTEIFISLVLDNKIIIVDLFKKIEIGLSGFYLIPAIIIAITNVKEETSKFIQSLIVKVLLPLTIIAMVIIYVYMAKIIVLKAIPANSIYRIITAIFVLAFITWTTAYSFKDKSKFIEKSCKIIPYTFIPFLMLQIYSISVRCIENGITPIRYLGIAFIIFEAFAIFLTVLKNRKYMINIFIVMVVLTLLSTIPPIDLHTISNESQARRLRNAWNSNQKFSQLSKENQKIAKGSYDYLISQADGKKYIPSYLLNSMDEMNEEMEKNYKQGVSTVTNGSIKFSEEENYILDVSQYKKLKVFHVNDGITDFFSTTDINNIYLNNEMKIDLKDYIDNAIAQNIKSDDGGANYVKNNNIIKYDDKTDIQITSFEFMYSVKDNALKNITYLRITGNILTK